MPRLPLYAKDYAMRDFGKHLRLCRELNDTKQSDLAEQIGVTQQTISQMEKNPKKMTLERLYDVNKVVSLDMIQILKAVGIPLPAIRDYFREYFADHK